MTQFKYATVRLVKSENQDDRVIVGLGKQRTKKEKVMEPIEIEGGTEYRLADKVRMYVAEMPEYMIPDEAEDWLESKVHDEDSEIYKAAQKVREKHVR